MPLKQITISILSESPWIILQKTLRLVYRKWKLNVVRKLDFFYPTHSKYFSRTTQALGTCLQKPSLDSLIANSVQTLSLANLYLNHTFDLLGSGWVQVRHGMDCRGVEGYHYSMGSHPVTNNQGTMLGRRVNTSNKAYSRKLGEMVSRDYTPIDWQLDFKSGYRWQEKKPASYCSPAPLAGADIKVPWELSRMQHLPQLALAYGLASQEVDEAQPPEVYSNEFRNQVLDFIATNPPRFGVNWYSSMDVGIRVSNWLVAYDLFKVQGASFDPDFEQAFINSVYDHGLHIIQNLDWNLTFRNNHYLADIVGLLFVSTYLPRSPETDTWLAFSVQELIHTMEEQFHADGSNFEASTSYHRLSAEMMLYGTALILGLPDSKREALKFYPPISLHCGPKLQKAPLPFFQIPGLDQPSPIPPTHFEKLKKLADFSRATTKPNGQAIQIGDNDNGRFLKLHPAFQKSDSTENWSEDYLNHTHLVRAIEGLFGMPTDIESQIVCDLAGGIPLLSSSPKISPNHVFSNNSVWDEWKQKLDEFPPEQCNNYEIFSQGHNLTSDLEHLCFPDFGLYLIVSPILFLSIRCGSVGQNGKGGHAHNDALSIELQIDGVDHITDPGSYLYTPSPEIRNAYRSVKAHFAPSIDQREPNPIDHRLFQMEDRAQAQCLYFGDNGFIGMHRGYGSPVYRLIQVEEDRLIIKDAVDGPEKLILLDPLNPTNGLPFSSGYGIRLH